MEGLVFGGAYLRGEICVSKSIGLAYIVGSKFTVFALFYFVFDCTSPPSPGRELIFGAVSYLALVDHGLLRNYFTFFSFFAGTIVC